MDTHPISRVQFTLRELLIFVSVTFLGMCVFGPLLFARQPFLGCVAVTMVTAAGLLLGSSCCGIQSQRRLIWQLAGMGLAWLTLFVFGSAIVMYDRSCAGNLMMLALPAIIAAMVLMRVLAPVSLRRTSFSTGLAAALMLSAMTVTPAFATPRTFNDRLALWESDLARQDRVESVRLYGMRSLSGVRAPGSSSNYMTLGYALNAIPGIYDSTGRDQFIINSSGTIFSRDPVGSNTTQTPTFNPDTTWIPTQ